MDALPERRLIGAIIDTALTDAKIIGGSGIRAAEFLMGPRSTPYFVLLDLDPYEYRKGLWNYANKYVSLGNDARDRRNLRINIEEAVKVYGLQIPY